MRLILFALSVFISLSVSGQSFNNVLKTAKKKTGLGEDSKLTNEEVVSGLKEALTRGSNIASETVSKADGYYKDPKIKIPFPPEAIEVKEKLDAMGMKQQTEKFVLTMNRAAEEAAKEAAPIFVAAIKGMSVSDGFAILRGDDDAATVYLRNTTGKELMTKFRPVIKRAIEEVELTKVWNPLITKYNKIPFVEKQNPDLEEYITEKAIAGLFYMVMQEELKIRQDPMARVSDLLKKVFGSGG